LTAGDNLFGRLLKRAPLAGDLPDVLGSPATGLHLYLDGDAPCCRWPITDCP